MYFPIFMNIVDEDCLVVGGGDIAWRKIQLLKKADARITVISPELCEALLEMQAMDEINWLNKPYESSDITGYKLIIAATDDNEVNRLVSADAKQHCIPVNVVDNPPLCSFIVPSTIDRDPVQIAISTGGASPVLARLLRSRLETFIPSAYGRLASLMRDFRERVKNKIPNMRERRRFWEQVLNGPVTEMFLAGQDKAGLQALEESLEQSANAESSRGEVYLVGGGPGDPDLLTFRALRLIQQAEVVVYDRLVAKAIVDLARRDADFIYVGKKQDQHTVPQEGINELLVQHAKAGKRVVRLKGGDPFIFGRGGEEIEHLTEAGISFQIVPGVTAASGCSSYAGIPLTHRDYAQSCIFVTGHMKNDQLSLNWDVLIKPKQTVVVYMGVAAIEQLSQKLIEHGMNKETPAAIIEKGTMPQQQVYVETLASLEARVRQSDIKPPSLIIIGDVVKLHDKLAWFQT